MKIHCFGCNTVKDTEILEMYCGSSGLVNDEPISPLLVLDVEGPQHYHNVNHGDTSQHLNHHHEFRSTVVCHNCFDKLDPDMWINKMIWESIKPCVPFDKLPPCPCTYSEQLSLRQPSPNEDPEVIAQLFNNSQTQSINKEK